MALTPKKLAHAPGSKSLGKSEGRGGMAAGDDLPGSHGRRVDLPCIARERPTSRAKGPRAGHGSGGRPEFARDG